MEASGGGKSIGRREAEGIWGCQDGEQEPCVGLKTTQWEADAELQGTATELKGRPCALAGGPSYTSPRLFLCVGPHSAHQKAQLEHLPHHRADGQGACRTNVPKGYCLCSTLY